MAWSKDAALQTNLFYFLAGYCFKVLVVVVVIFRSAIQIVASNSR